MADPAFDHPTQDLRFARLEALREAVDDLLRQRPRLTSTYTDTWTHVHIRERIDRGLESVPVYKIVGSASRYIDFDRWLLQWDREEQLHRKVAQTQSFVGSQSPIELYKVGEVYFVKDGNYRLESARARGQLFLPAHVVEYQIDSTLTELDEIHNLLLCDERTRFLEATELEQLRPTQEVMCTTLGNYPQIVQHIEDHCSDLRDEWSRNISRDVAAASWYDTIYMPIINTARRQHLLQYFPDYREADLYLWAIEHRWQIREDGLTLQWSNTEEHARKQPALRDRLTDALSILMSLGHAMQTIDHHRTVHV